MVNSTFKKAFLYQGTIWNQGLKFAYFGFLMSLTYVKNRPNPSIEKYKVRSATFIRPFNLHRPESAPWFLKIKVCRPKNFLGHEIDLDTSRSWFSEIRMQIKRPTYDTFCLLSLLKHFVTKIGSKFQIVPWSNKTLFIAVVSGGAGGALAPPEFRSSNNLIPTRKGRLCPPHYC